MADAKSPGLSSAFSSLRHRNYRLLWFGNVVSISGDWMDQIAFNWLIYDMTHSTIALAMVNLCRAGPILLFTLIGGVVADRVERRRLLFVTQLISMMFAFLLAGLLSAGLLEVWMTFVIAAARGITNSFNQPARQSLISELVPPEALPSAVALNSATMNLTRVIGPALGGVLIATVGVAGCFYFNAFSFLAVLYTLTLMQFAPFVSSQKKSGMLGELTAGLRYLNRQAGLRTLVILALVPMVLGQPYQTMLTVFAKDVFEVGGEGLGLLQAVSAGGAVIGAIFVGSMTMSSRFSRQMMIGIIGFGGFLLAFSFSQSFLVALGFLALAGFANQIYNTTNNSLLQMNVDAEYRGRVLSTMFLQRGMVPLGTVMAGLLSTAIGPRWTMGSMALALVLIGVLATPYVTKTLRDMTAGQDKDAELQPVQAAQPKATSVRASR